MKLKNIITSKQFDQNTISEILGEADKIKSGKYNKGALEDKIMATLFYEPSTRTRLSFESSMQRLGGSVIATENASEFSSAAKGETLEDTIRIVHSYSDVIVLRHFSPGASEIASNYSKVPIINAGDGNGEHPTQSLLDLFTIFSHFKKRDLHVVLVGDLLNGRTIHSLSFLLSLYKNVKMTFVSPEALQIPKSLREDLNARKASFEETETLDSILRVADVVYMTRIQKERFKTESEYNEYFGKYVIDVDTLTKLKKEALIMHPLPRINEITQDVDSDERAIYFEQSKNGVYVRMALLLLLLKP